MGGPRRPAPPKPPALPPVASKAKDYSMDRPSEVQNELDELRNRGLAKVLNRHFTDTTKKLAKEKAAADAALADLERRRANTSEFVPSKSGELSPFDAMYVELQQKRAECRRKERETVLLYQRYVHKYGSQASSSKVASNGAVTPSSAAKHSEEELSPVTSASTPEVPPPPSPLPIRSTLHPLDENSEDDADGAVDSGINFSRFYNKRIQEVQSTRDPPTKTSSDSTTSVKDVPELEELTPQQSKEESAAPCNDPPELEAPRTATDEDLVEENKAMSKRVSCKSDPPADPPAVSFANDPVEEPSTVAESVKEPDESVKSNSQQPIVVEEQIVEESSSTPVESTVKSAAERLEIGSDASDSHRPTREVTAEIPAPAAAALDEEEDDRSIISGLTMNSQVTRQVMEEIEHEMSLFLSTETEAIRKLLDEEEERLHDSFVLDTNTSVVGVESRRASLKAEVMALEMQKILNQYAAEDPSESAHGADETEVETDTNTVGTNGYPRKFETSDPTKNWMVFYDESFKREYYFETNSKTTQWEPPGSTRMAMEPLDFTEREVAPSSLKRTSSRRDLYRKKVRKQRMRRAAALGLVVLCAGGTVYQWKRQYPDKSLSEAIVAGFHSTSSEFVSVVDSSLYAIAEGMESTGTYVKDTFEYTFTDRKAREEAEAAERMEMEKRRKAEEAAAEKERLRIEAERKALEAKRLQEQKEREEAEARRMREEARRRELELQAIEAKKRAEEEAIRRSEAEHKALERPWGCFLPLAYIHPRCNRLAKIKPIYKDTDVLNSFMQ